MITWVEVLLGDTWLAHGMTLRWIYDLIQWSSGGTDENDGTNYVFWSSVPIQPRAANITVQTGLPLPLEAEIRES